MIISLSTIFSLYAFEVYIIYKNRTVLVEKDLKKRTQIYESKSNKIYDRRSKLEVYNDLVKQNKDIVTTVFPYKFVEKKNLDFFPLSGISKSKTINCNESGFYATYESDRFGFNNPDKEWISEEIEYVIVGDSFAFGDCVNRPNDITSVLRNLSNKPALNLAYSGNGPLIEYATLREFLPKNVKKIIWIYYGVNDIFELDSESKNNILSKYLKDKNFSQQLKKKQFITDKIGKKIIQSNKEGKVDFPFKKFFKIYHTRQSIFKSSTAESYSFSLLKRVLKLTKELSEKNNSKMYFVYLPAYSQYNSKNYDQSNYLKIKKIISELNIPFIDIDKEVFKKEKNPLELFPFQLPGHFNKTGYKKVAESIYEKTSN
tara:strand:- start:2358 stop:3473 length:1116 start_codon:yes stop_codon:yes gene_type:complete